MHGMRTVATIAAGTVVCALAVTTTGAAAQTGPLLRPAAPAGPAAVPGEIVVGFRAGVDGAARAATRSAADVRAARNLLVPRGQLVKVEPGQTVDDAIAALERRADVRYAEPNWIYHASSTTPDDPRFGNLWGLRNTGQTVDGQAGTADADIDAPEAWDRNRGSASTVVAVADSGVAWEHPDLAPNVWSNADEIAGNGVDDDGNGRIDDVRGWDFVDRDNNPWDYDGHGTHVAGTIAARGNNGVGVTGVAWQASIMPVRVLDALGSGTNANIADGFTYAAANGAKVVNASLGGGFESQTMSNAITSSPNTLFVVAAGNDGANNEVTPQYPCNFEAANVVCVAATDNTDALAGFSNYGSISVDLAAPGVDIESARPHETDAFSDGFESGLGAWTVQSGPWGTQSVLGTTWLVDSPNTTYASNADWAIRTSAKVDVGVRTDCALRFNYGTFLAAGDWLFVQSSTDGTTWTDMGRIGDTDGFIEDAFLALAGGSRYYRFRLTSDASVNESGAFIDNVRISCPGGTYGSDDYAYSSGTSMAAPHIAGAAAVLLSDTPRATVAEVKAALLNSGDPVADLIGRTVSGRRLNLNAALTSLVHKASTTTTITSDDPDPSLVSQPVTVRYSVAVNAPDSSTPSGNVTVSDGSHSCTGTVAAGECTITLATPGSRTLTATYAGDADHYTSSASVAHRVDAADTTTTITADAPDPSEMGQAVSVEFTVEAVAPASGTPPLGLVVVSDGVDSCSAAVTVGGCSLDLTTPGARTLTAAYLGTPGFNGSTSSEEAHTVSGLATTTTITADDPDPSVVGEAVTVQYGVTAADGTPTGDVTVSDGSVSCTATVAAGGCTLTFTSAGANQLTATYAGEDTFAASTSSVEAHTVNAAATATTLTAHDPAPSTPGGAITVRYSVAVNAPGAGTPTGAVRVTDGVDSCTATVAAGRCTLSLATVGARTLTAAYAGDGNFLASRSSGAPHTVSAPASTGDAPPDTAIAQPPTTGPESIPLARVSGASQTNPRFRVAAKRQLARISRRRAPLGTTFKFTLDTAAAVRFDFARRGAGRAQRRSLTFGGHTGLNTVRFKGWVSRTRKLTPGRYTLTITAITPGVGETTQQLRFRIVG
jgi:subtilisin family serine protease